MAAGVKELLKVGKALIIKIPYWPVQIGSVLFILIKHLSDVLPAGTVIAGMLTCIERVAEAPSLVEGSELLLKDVAFEMDWYVEPSLVESSAVNFEALVNLHSTPLPLATWNCAFTVDAEPAQNMLVDKVGA